MNIDSIIYWASQNVAVIEMCVFACVRELNSNYSYGVHTILRAENSCFKFRWFGKQKRIKIDTHKYS